MEKREYEQKVSLINALRAEALKYKNEFINQVNGLTSNSKDALSTLQGRDDTFFEYVSNVGDFSYSDKYTSPSDLFPGIRTVSDMVDPDEMKRKIEMMKSASVDIDNANKISSLQVKLVSSNLRQALDAFSEYINRCNQIYDMELDLLQAMDSIYDIADIKKAVVN